MLLTASFACEGIASIGEKNALSQKEGYVIFSPILQSYGCYSTCTSMPAWIVKKACCCLYLI